MLVLHFIFLALLLCFLWVIGIYGFLHLTISCKTLVALISWWLLRMFFLYIILKVPAKGGRLGNWKLRRFTLWKFSMLTRITFEVKHLILHLIMRILNQAGEVANRFVRWCILNVKSRYWSVQWCLTLSLCVFNYVVSQLLDVLAAKLW